ncbi:MAG: copper amine oxidase N-terminal domain-containing protein [Clostridia bacterium]|nr:copper amine oxidase N-terminal domain-containing protein [Clostridia bacterium]
MKQRLQGLIAGILICTMITGGAAFAKSRVETIEVTYDDIKVYKDNVLCELKDANGNTIEPFIYNGTTYVPVRGAANLADMEVTWDGAEKSIYLWDEQVSDGTYLMDVCPPYETKYYEAYTMKTKGFSMAGEEYTNGFTIRPEWPGEGGGYAIFNLNSKYSAVEFTVGHVDGSSMYETTVYCFLDGELIKKFEVDPEALPKTISLPVTYGLQLKIVVQHSDEDEWDYDTCVGFGNITVR